MAAAPEGGKQSDGGEQSGGGKPSGRGVRIALAVSVALNLLIVGLVAGAVLRDGGPRGRMMGELDFGPFTEALTREDRDALRQAFVERMPDMRDMRRQMRTDFAALLAALRAEPFDPAALREVMANQSSRMQERLQIGQSLMLERLEAMSPEARAAFADRLEERLRHGPRGGMGDAMGGGAPKG
ncbi:periplasmic heavy metal sensor [Gemmobacter straminiformis]|uniref:Periplasmic heavy metal sensor n=2 Tax=Paragemmobacter straminiformis TaxID=2045119 RepID=A0A842IDF9_9RHOB|nr:periplasmic heavy metal sensor [Gemmobacter straminiformis]